MSIRFAPKLLPTVVAVLMTIAHATSLGAQNVVSKAEIKKLIDQLGDDRYILRVQAKEKLQQLGLEAFDELQRAKDHEDSEVVTAAHYLISSLLVSWSKESDPAPVREALSEYGAQERGEREARIERLAKLPNQQGLEALVRLVRFEPDLRLSRRAALALMQQPMSRGAKDREYQSTVVNAVLQESERVGAKWLRIYAIDLRDGGYSAEQWKEVLKQHRRELDANTTEQAGRVSVLELVRLCATRAVSSGQRDEAIRLASQNMDLIPPTTRDLVEASSWAIDNQLHEFVLALSEKNSRIFEQHPILLYSVAQAQLIGGNEKKAQELADAALAVNSLPKFDEDNKELSENEIEEIAKAHMILAKQLSDRGLFEWSEREYRQIIDGVKLTSLDGVRARALLADLLGELHQHQGVIDALFPVMERVKKDNVFKTRLQQRGGVSLSYVESQLEFHKGLLAKREGDIEAAKRSLRAAYKAYRPNVDILIAMFRIDSDDDWNQSVRRDIASRVRSIESEIRSAETRYRQRGQRPDDIEILSQALNEYAWLVSNTYGDHQRALQESLRSLELTPDDAAKTDTLARCYLTLGQLDNALKAQERAVELMPNSPPMDRQLAEIKQRIIDEESK